MRLLLLCVRPISGESTVQICVGGTELAPIGTPTADRPLGQIHTARCANYADDFVIRCCRPILCDVRKWPRENSFERRCTQTTNCRHTELQKFSGVIPPDPCRLGLRPQTPVRIGKVKVATLKLRRLGGNSEQCNCRHRECHICRVAGNTV